MAFTGNNSSDTMNTVGGYVAITFILLYIFIFAIGMGTVPWSINAEIYPLHLIGTANSLGASANWIADFIIAESFKLISSISLVAEIAMYVVLGAFSILSFLFVYFYMKETAGKPIE